LGVEADEPTVLLKPLQKWDLGTLAALAMALIMPAPVLRMFVTK
jgi:hypothetical protein